MFAYCGNNPVVRKDASGQEWVYVIDETETTVVEENDGNVTYETTIKYTRSKKRRWPWSPSSGTQEQITVALQYTVSSDGAISFDNKQSDASALVIECVQNALAEEMYTKCTEQVPESLSGRTIKGIGAELYWHYLSYDLNILSGPAEYANIGGLDKDKPGYDSNGRIFE